MAITCPDYRAVVETQEQLDGRGSFKCPKCDMEFDTKEQLDEHMRTMHSM